MEQAERAFRELVHDELEVGKRPVLLEAWEVVLTSLSNATNSARETLFAFSRNIWLRWW